MMALIDWSKWEKSIILKISKSTHEIKVIYMWRPIRCDVLRYSLLKDSTVLLMESAGQNNIIKTFIFIVSSNF